MTIGLKFPYLKLGGWWLGGWVVGRMRVSAYYSLSEAPSCKFGLESFSVQLKIQDGAECGKNVKANPIFGNLSTLITISDEKNI